MEVLNKNEDNNKNNSNKEEKKESQSAADLNNNNNNNNKKFDLLKEVVKTEIQEIILKKFKINSNNYTDNQQNLMTILIHNLSNFYETLTFFEHDKVLENKEKKRLRSLKEKEEEELEEEEEDSRPKKHLKKFNGQPLKENQQKHKMSRSSANIKNYIPNIKFSDIPSEAIKIIENFLQEQISYVGDSVRGEHHVKKNHMTTREFYKKSKPQCKAFSHAEIDQNFCRGPSRCRKAAWGVTTYCATHMKLGNKIDFDDREALIKYMYVHIQKLPCFLEATKIEKDVNAYYQKTGNKDGFYAFTQQQQ